MNDLREITGWSSPQIRPHTGLTADHLPGAYDLGRASSGPLLRSKEKTLHDKTETAWPRAGPH
jgi:hypothetical protein